MPQNPQDRQIYLDLEDTIGQLGWYQMFTIGLYFIVLSIAAANTNMPVFAIAKPDFKCQIEKNDTFETSPAKLNSCYDTLNTSQSWTHPITNNAKSENLTICENFHYDTSEYQSTIYTEFNLMCSESKILSSLSTSAYFLGFIVGCIVCPAMHKFIGRKDSALYSGIFMCVTQIYAAYAPNLYHYMAAKVLIGAGMVLVNGAILPWLA